MDEVSRCINKPPAEKQKSLRNLENILDGYVATNDPPLTLLIPELMEMYPNAKVDRKQPIAEARLTIPGHMLRP